jgi:hypothetical protein
VVLLDIVVDDDVVDRVLDLLNPSGDAGIGSSPGLSRPLLNHQPSVT